MGDGYTCAACGESTGFNGHYSATIDDYTCRRKPMGDGMSDGDGRRRGLGPRRIHQDDNDQVEDVGTLTTLETIPGGPHAPRSPKPYTQLAVKRPKAIVLHEWDHGKQRLRLIAKADHTPGYEDEYVVEKLTQDALGEPRWDLIVSWRTNANPQDANFTVEDWLKTLNSFVDGIKSLLRDQRGPT